MVILVFLTALVVQGVLCVNRGKFKTCYQSGFCNRLMNEKQVESRFLVDQSSVSCREGTSSATVRDVVNGATLSFIVDALTDSRLRVRVKEQRPLFERFEVFRDGWKGIAFEPVADKTVITEAMNGGKTCGFRFRNGVSAVVDLSSLSVKVSSKENEELLVINGENYLLVEPHVNSPSRPVAPDRSSGSGSVSSEELGSDSSSVSSEELGSDSSSVSSEELDSDSSSISDSDISSSSGSSSISSSASDSMSAFLEDDSITTEQNQSQSSPSLSESFDGHTDSMKRGHQAVRFDASFHGFEHVYGIPEHADTFNLNTESGDPYRLFNLDVFEFELYNRMALYGSVPLMVAKNQNASIGLLFLNAAEMWVSLKRLAPSILSSIFGYGKRSTRSQVNTRWVAESGIIDLFVFTGPSPADVSYQNALTVGFQQLPPLFSLGYHQCRWNYMSQDEVHEVAANFDLFNTSFDVIWLDIEHTNDKRYFTFKTETFPDPLRMLHSISSTGRKMVSIVDPHVKQAGDYRVYNEAQANDFCVKNSRNETYVGWCWPGNSVYPDFVREDVRNWWSSQFDVNKYIGSTEDMYTWIDMNEPSVFNGPEVTVPKDSVHGYWENRDVHNLYGQMYQLAAFNGGLVRSKNLLRPFVLSRAFFAGSQRYGAVWTGDNAATWEHLKITVPMLLSLSVAGIHFCGADVGGFFGNPDEELFVRWYQAASMQPFFRSHAHIETKRREPWSYGEATLKSVRLQIDRRYVYMPYVYTLFHESSSRGRPVMRPLWFEFPSDSAALPLEDSYMFGNALLVKPIMEAGVTSVSVYFPSSSVNKTKWFSTFSDEVFVGGNSWQVKMLSRDDLPMFQRSGSIVPMRCRRRRATSHTLRDPVTLTVALDDSLRAHGSMYVDDGITLNYLKREHCLLDFWFSNFTLTVSASGQHRSDAWLERVVLMGDLPRFSSARVLSNDVDHTVRVITSGNKQVIRKPGAVLHSGFTVQLVK